MAIKVGSDDSEMFHLSQTSLTDTVVVADHCAISYPVAAEAVSRAKRTDADDRLTEREGVTHLESWLEGAGEARRFFANIMDR